MSEEDGPTTATSVDFEAYGVTYAITDDFSVGYNISTSDKASESEDQEATGISASWTSGGITVAGMMNSVDNVSHETTDAEGYQLDITFAF